MSLESLPCYETAEVPPEPPDWIMPWWVPLACLLSPIPFIIVGYFVWVLVCMASAPMTN